MQSQIKKIVKKLALIMCICLLGASNIAFADKGQKNIELLLGATTNNDLPVILQASYLYGFNELTDLSVHIATDYSSNDKVIEFGVGSFYTQRIGDISPQYGFSVGPRIHSINNTESKNLFLKVHFRAVFELDYNLHLIGEYSPGVEFGDNGTSFHQIKVGVRF